MQPNETAWLVDGDCDGAVLDEACRRCDAVTMRSTHHPVSAFGAACVAAVGLLLIVACGSSGVPGDSVPTTRVPFRGPLFVAKPPGKHAAWAGAAGTIVQCTGRPGAVGTSTAPYRIGSVGHTPDGSLDDAPNVVSVAVDLLHLERRETDRALYTSVYGGRVIQALVVRYGPAAPGTGADEHGKGWWPESWAACDFADWPEAASHAEGVEVWSDARGRRIDTRRVVSWTDNGDNCLGDDEVKVGSKLFVRAPTVEADGYYQERYRQHQHLPSDAVDTGWSRDGTHLWLSSSRTLAYLGKDSADVEFWPELTANVGCG